MENASSPAVVLHGNQGDSSFKESEAAPEGISEEPTTPPPQEAANPSQKVVKEKCCQLYFSCHFFFLRDKCMFMYTVGLQCSLASLTLNSQ